MIPSFTSGKTGGKRARPRVVRLVPELDFGGVESRLLLQAGLMDDSRFELRVCTFWKAGAAADAIRRTGTAVDVLDVPPRRSVATLGRLVRYLRQTRPDVLHCSVTEANVLGLTAGALTGVPVRIAEEVGMPSHRWRARIAFGALYRTATCVVGVTQAVCDYLVQVDRAPASRVRRIYNCAHPRFFPDARASLARSDAERATFLVVGRLHPIKNHETLIRAFARVVAVRPNARMVLVGDGALRERIDALRGELGLSASTELLGFRDDVDELLRRSGAFVLGSHAEGCSISLIEAMAAGLPALGSSVAGIREVLGEALARRWTVPPTDIEAWTALMNRYLDLTPDDRVALASAAQQRAYERFSPKRYIAELEALYAGSTQPRGSECLTD